jgi:hypothetical protein
MTPQQCLETRLRLGWSRKDLAAAACLATPIVRLYEAGALAGFEDCEAAIGAALSEAEAESRRSRVRVFRKREGRIGGFAETSVRWRGAEWMPLARAC